MPKTTTCCWAPSSRSRWSYAASKLLDEFLGLAAHREYGLPVTIVRFFNTVGPGQTGRYGMVVPRFVRAALRGEPIPVFGDGLQSRCFCHVRDSVRAVVQLLDLAERHVGRNLQHRQQPGSDDQPIGADRD